jgi:hypothetical protein
MSIPAILYFAKSPITKFRNLKNHSLENVWQAHLGENFILCGAPQLPNEANADLGMTTWWSPPA